MFFFFQAEDGIRDLVRSRGLGDVYKRQQHIDTWQLAPGFNIRKRGLGNTKGASQRGLGEVLSLIHI